jgi:hypothetical protein
MAINNKYKWNIRNSAEKLRRMRWRDTAEQHLTATTVIRKMAPTYVEMHFNSCVKTQLTLVAELRLRNSDLTSTATSGVNQVLSHSCVTYLFWNWWDWIPAIVLTLKKDLSDYDEVRKSSQLLMFRAVFWDVLPCKIIVDRRFRSAYCLHHQGRQSFYTAVHPRRQLWTSYSPPWEPEISRGTPVCSCSSVTLPLPF